MKSEKMIITQQELDDVWGNANFGDISKFDVIRYALLKVAAGYYQGYTAACILKDLKLIGKRYRLTKRGEYNLYELFKNENKYS